MKSITGRKLRVAWLGFWQAHSAPAPDFQFPGPGTAVKAIDHPHLDVVVAWDDDAARGRDRAQSLGIPFVAELDAILGDPAIDGVIICAATNQHRDLITRAARAGKHVHTAKVLAPTLALAREIVDEVQASGVTLITDMGWLYKDFVLRIRELIEAGAVGELVSIRIAHYHSMATAASPIDRMGYYPDNRSGFLSRDEAWGGALVDMCHPTYITPLLCGGLPTSAFSRFRSVSGRGNVEDNAIVLFDYEDGPYVTIEAGWTTPPMTTAIEVNGTRGTIIYRSARGIPEAEQFVLRSGDDAAFKPVDKGQNAPSTLDIWVESIRSGTWPAENVERALDLALLNEAAYRSADARAPALLSDIKA